MLPQVLRHHHVREGPEHRDQLGDVHESREARDRLVLAGRLELELGRDVAEGRGPGVELVQAAIQKRRVAEIALHREHLAERVGDRRTGGEHQRPAGVLCLDEAGLYIEIPGALRAVGVDALQRRHVGGEGQLAELLRLIDDDLVDADLRDGEEIVLPRGECFEPFLQALLQPLKPLARDTVLALDLGEQLLVQLELVLDHLLLERGRHANEAKRRVRDDDRIPGRGRGARQEAMPLVLGKVGLVGDEDARARIERQELTRGLRQAMAGNDEHRLGDQAEPALLHDGSRYRHRLAGAHGMSEIGRARGDDAPDAPLLMSVKDERARGARQLQMRAIEGARHDIVEAVVVDPRQAIGSIRIGPDPVLEGGLDLLQLLPRRLGIDDVEDATLALAVLDGVEDLRH